MRSGASRKKQPPEMSITGGRNPPIDKGGEIVGGGENWIIHFHIRFLCAFAHISWRGCHNFQGRSNGRGTGHGRPVASLVLTHSTTCSDSLPCSLLPCPAQRLNRLCSIPTWSSALPMLWWMISMIDSGL
jgi:hypothetical protein